MENDEEIKLDDGLVKPNGKLKRMRNMRQYKNLSDEKFNEIVLKKSLGIEQSKEFEKRIQKKLDEFNNDYDLSDLKINDRDTLRALIQAQITLEDYEQFQFKNRLAGISESNIMANKEIQKAMSDLRADISKLQGDLNITRKIRKSDQDVSVMAYIDGLKEKARKFYASKMSYIFCPKCNQLLATVWSLYPDNDRNKIALVCERTLEDGTKCGEKVIVSTKELLMNRGTNKREIVPESML